MIQQSINQMLNTFAVMGRLNPELDKKRELEAANKKAGVLSNRLQAAYKTSEEYSQSKPTDEIGKDPEMLQGISDVYGAQYENYKKLFNLDPNEEYFNKMTSAKAQSDYIRSQAKNLALKRDEAIKSMNEKASVQLEQDADFKKHRESILLGANGQPLKVEV